MNEVKKFLVTLILESDLDFDEVLNTALDHFCRVNKLHTQQQVSNWYTQVCNTLPELTT